ncbi:hypothetical protein [Streptomyces sp. MB09-02B]|uniref:hypothetical protein n=1 Tax=Streptomyces sp. MB09-02B TaxID=3028667 RepID=UPI0029A9EE6E|nr:hypothetical protein [Streptomyces sp. MB09-02B]MDX3645373.1 hypothetical protein [Streptomyces sp. MB09-02B]
MIRRRVADLVSSRWGRLYTACTLLAVVLGGWSVVRTFASPGRDGDPTRHLFSAAMTMCFIGLLFLGLHERHLRARRGEAAPLDVRRVAADLRSLPTSANGKVALAFAGLGVAGWAYAWVGVRWLGWDMPGVPDAGDGGLVVRAGTLSCAIAGIFAVTHFRERR